MNGFRGHGVRALAWTVGAAGLFVLLLFISASAGFSLDESWFLEVVDRVARGETLYRDVFYLSTPLPVQFTVVLAHVFGSGILVEKAATAVACVGEFAFALLLARECGMSRRSTWLACLALFVYAQHFPNPPYRAIGSALMLGAFWTLVVWVRRSRDQATARHAAATRWLVATGALAGACFSAMPNHGLLTLASAALVIVMQRTRAPRRVRDVVGGWTVLSLAFAAVVLICLAPVALSGSLGAMLDYTLLNKGPYVRSGGVSFWSELTALIIVNPITDPDALARIYRGLVMVLAPLTIVAMVVAWRQSAPERRVQAAAILLLVVSGVVGAYPRLNRFHLSYAAPGLIVGLVFSSTVWQHVLRVSPRVARAVVAAWLVAGAASTMVGLVKLSRSDAAVWSSLPHFRGVRLARAEQEEIASRAERMALVLGPTPLIISPYASVYYLVAGLKNPTPFDESSVMSFGVRGQRDVVAALDAGRWRPVCLGTITESLRPLEIERYVRTTLTRGEDLGVCMVYR